MSKKNSNLGKLLEDKIMVQNELYRRKKQATFNKIPNNWVVRRKGPHIIGANPVPSGLCDFIGTEKAVGGRMIVFDAKECSLKTRFPLSNIKPGQMDHMQETIDHGGVAFLVIQLNQLNKVYYAPYDFIYAYWQDAENNPQERNKSIPFRDIEAECIEIKNMDYLKVMHQWLDQE
ncbi:holliday junction resolvase [Bacillus phage vB_BpsM-61]|nr:holliday junction resolvase [Bacillus phage vB_BpsM-61]